MRSCALPWKITRTDCDPANVSWVFRGRPPCSSSVTALPTATAAVAVNAARVPLAAVKARRLKFFAAV